jgi:hypothetical protein
MRVRRMSPRWLAAAVLLALVLVPVGVAAGERMGRRDATATLRDVHGVAVGRSGWRTAARPGRGRGRHRPLRGAGADGRRRQRRDRPRPARQLRQHSHPLPVGPDRRARTRRRHPQGGRPGRSGGLRCGQTALTARMLCTDQAARCDRNAMNGTRPTSAATPSCPTRSPTVTARDAGAVRAARSLAGATAGAPLRRPGPGRRGGAGHLPGGVAPAARLERPGSGVPTAPCIPGWSGTRAAILGSCCPCSGGSWPWPTRWRRGRWGCRRRRPGPAGGASRPGRRGRCWPCGWPGRPPRGPGGPCGSGPRRSAGATPWARRRPSTTTRRPTGRRPCSWPSPARPGPAPTWSRPPGCSTCPPSGSPPWSPPAGSG